MSIPIHAQSGLNRPRVSGKTSGRTSVSPQQILPTHKPSGRREWSRSQVPERSQIICQAQDAAGPGPTGGFNPFRPDPNKEDAARKALQDMFKGKQDTLAAFDSDGRGGDSGGKGKSGGGGGSGGSGWSFPDWRGWLGSFGGRFGELGKAFQAILAFAAVMLAVCYLGDAISFVTGGLTLIVRWVLRLDARKAPPRRARQPAISVADPEDQHSDLGPSERSVLEKYGPPATPAYAYSERQ